MNLLQCDGIFFNLYTVCLLILLTSQNLAENTEAETSDHFYLVRKVSDGYYYEDCYVVCKSVILNSGIFKQIPGLSCTVVGNEVLITSDRGNSKITISSSYNDRSDPKPIYWMSKSFIENIIRSGATDYFAMDEITIGSLFTQLQLKQYSTSSSNFMIIKNEDGDGLARFFLSIDSNYHNAHHYGYITWLKPGTNVLKFYFYEGCLNLFIKKFFENPSELYINHIKDFNESHDIILTFHRHSDFKYFFSEKSCFAVENEGNSNLAIDCSEKEIAIRDFENLEIDFTRTDVQSFNIGDHEFNVTLTKNNETNKYLAIYKARYLNNSETEVFHFRKTFDLNENQNYGNRKILPLFLIISSLFLIFLISAFIIYVCICKKQQKPTGEIPLHDVAYQFNNIYE